MSTETIIVIAVTAGALVVIITAAMMASTAKRRQELQDQFGPEYDRTMSEAGSRRLAEKELDARRERVRKLELVELSSVEQGRFAAEWAQVQARFVDDPYGAIERADRLLIEVMQARGYPMADFEQRAADISVDHPQVVSNYRSAHDIAAMPNPTTEQMRQALVYYRALFTDLLAPVGSAV
jgi:hypothetical protein